MSSDSIIIVVAGNRRILTDEINSNYITSSSGLFRQLVIENSLTLIGDKSSLISANISVNNAEILKLNASISTLDFLTVTDSSFLNEVTVGTSLLVNNSAVIGTTLQVKGETQIDGGTNITGTLNVLGKVILNTLAAGDATISNLFCTNQTVTNLVATTSLISNIINTDFISSNITCSNIANINLLTTKLITTGNLLITGSPTTANTLTIDANSSITNPAALIFKNTNGTGDFRIYGDGGDTQWQGGGGRALQMGSYHEIRLTGGRALTSNLPFVTGSGGVCNTIILNTNDSVGLTVRSHTTQNSDLQQWTDSSGNIYSKIDKIGNLVINSTADSISSITGGSITTLGGVSICKSVDIGSTVNANNTSTGSLVVSGGAGFNGDIHAKNLYSNGVKILFGTEYNYTEVVGSSGTTNTNFQQRVAMTTGSLLGGTYKINIGYTLGNPFFANSDGIFYGLLDGNSTQITSGTLIYEYSDTNSKNAYIIPKYNSVTKTLSSGIHTISLIYKSGSNGSVIYISDARIELFRVK
jgi:hypothetical protein